MRYNVTLLSAEFIGKENASYIDDEPMTIRLTWKNNSEITNLCLRMEIHRLDATPVASTIINNFYDGESGELVTRDFSVDLSPLMDGVYKIVFAPFYKNEFGKKSDVDHVEGLSFTKIQGRSSKRIMWQTRDWGDIQLPEIALA